MNPTIAEVVQFSRGERNESLAIIGMARRTGREVFECRQALRAAKEAMRNLADITNPKRSESLPYVLEEPTCGLCGRDNLEEERGDCVESRTHAECR